jgi:pyruvate-formate lyase-activating enzyme
VTEPGASWSLEGRLKLLFTRAENAYVLEPPFPRNLMIDLTNACNHACIFCANPKMTRKISQMSPELLRSILEQAYALGGREVGFYTNGDSFMHPRLAEFVRLAKDLGHEYVYLSTNGALATPERSKAVVDAGVDSIKFSINAASRETYKVIHGKDELDKVVRHLKFISEYRASLKRPLRLSVTFVVIALNRHEQERLRAELGAFVDDIYFSMGDCQQGNMPEIADLLAPEATAAPDKAPCYMVFSRVHVSSEGYLKLCCVDYENYLVVADLNRTPLKEAWTSPLFTRMRERHLANELEGTLCFNCIHGKQTPVEPLLPELATRVDYGSVAEANRKDVDRRIRQS